MKANDPTAPIPQYAQQILRRATLVKLLDKSKVAGKISNYPVSLRREHGVIWSHTDMPILEVVFDKAYLAEGMHRTPWVDRVATRLNLQSSLNSHREWEQVNLLQDALGKAFPMSCATQWGRRSSESPRFWMYDGHDSERNQNDPYAVAIGPWLPNHAVFSTRAMPADAYVEAFRKAGQRWVDLHEQHRAATSGHNRY